MGAIHIALTFDDNFWAPAYATMRSVCLFTRRRKELVFHLLHRTLTAEHVADLKQIETEFGARLVFYDLDQNPSFTEIAARMPANSRWPAIVYGRLLIDQLLPADVARVLYLDCDIMLQDDVAQIHDIDLQGHPIAAVRDTLGAFIAGGKDLRAKADTFDIADPYFNSGVIVIDVEAWRQARILTQMDALLAQGIMARLYYDQDLLNLVFRNTWLPLPARWNTIEARRAHEPTDPAILHYTSKQKPWFLFGNVAQKRLYRHVMTNKVFYDFMRHRWRRTLLKRLGLL
ncbi:glycosyltransferase family 8 protein [Devosia sp.]|uniref:glycosyltransferase family 8 protein n=1 Tax=Devosia sp. TaxID=1871048 RepID=UPI003262D978